MIIDKSLGFWNLDKANKLDDIAYYLFVNDFIKCRRFGKQEISYSDYLDVPDQNWFGDWSDIEIQSDYYKSAKILIRKEKLEKLNEQRF